MPWTLHLPGRDVDVAAELPLKLWAEVEKETGVQWIDAAARPLTNAWVAVLITEKAAAHFGIEPPALTAANVLEVWEYKPDEPEDFPTSGSPTDKAEDSLPGAAPTTTS